MKSYSRQERLRILCISPLFVPAADSEAFCGAKIVQALRQCGACVAVLVSDGIFGGTMRDSSPWWESVRQCTFNVPQVAERQSIESVFDAVRFQTPLYARWIARVLEKALALHREQTFDLVYSRSLPAVAHLAGFWCAEKLNLPWVVNMNDPWHFAFFPSRGTEPVKTPWFDRKAYLFWLRRTLKRADLITYPCKGLHDLHTELTSYLHAATIIPHVGFEARGRVESLNGRFCLVHAGKLGATEWTGERSTVALLTGFKQFIDCCANGAHNSTLVLVGPQDEQTQRLVRELHLTNNVESVGRVNYQESLQYIASASVCVLIEGCETKSVFFPSKLADYLVCGKPVLALSPPIGFAADLAARKEVIRVDHHPESVRTVLTSLYADFARGSLNTRAPTAAITTELQGSSVAKNLLAACDEAISRFTYRKMQREQHASVCSASNTS